MPYSADDQLRINAAIALLANPGPYDVGPIFVQIPRNAWRNRGYQYTLTLQWSQVPVQGLADILVRAHVHYKWQGGQWIKVPGNAWISGVAAWQTPTTPAVVALAPALPPDVGYHPHP
ncbi:MAG: hypothetical protein ACREP7_01570 [Lysobacter sp.]